MPYYFNPNFLGLGSGFFQEGDVVSGPELNLEEICQKLDGWFVQNKLPVSSVFSNFYRLLLTNYFSTKSHLLLNDGAKSLKKITTLLDNVDIPFNVKQRALIHLKGGMQVCADGILTNIENAKSALLGCTSFNETD